jgi:hypothetical protein
LARSYFAVSTVHGNKYQWKDEQASLEKAETIARKLVEAYPDVLADRKSLAEILNNLGLNQARQNRLVKAEALLREAIFQARVPFDRRPDVPDHRRVLNATYGTLGEVLRAGGKLGGSVAITLERQRLWSNNSLEQYRIARDLALSTKTVGKGKPALTPDDRAEREKYLELALKALRQAVASGYHDEVALRKEPAWDVFRGRKEFSQVLVLIQKPTPTPAK